MQPSKSSSLKINEPEWGHERIEALPARVESQHRNEATLDRLLQVRGQARAIETDVLATHGHRDIAG